MSDPTPDPPPVVYKYCRTSGEFLAGVPARDLTQSDVDALDPWARAELDANVGETGKSSTYSRVDLKQSTRGSRKGEAPDPVVPGATDADQITAGQSPYRNIPPTTADPATTVTTEPVTGEPTPPPGQVQSDRLA